MPYECCYRLTRLRVFVRSMVFSVCGASMLFVWRLQDVSAFARLLDRPVAQSWLLGSSNSASTVLPLVVLMLLLVVVDCVSTYRTNVATV